MAGISRRWADKPGEQFGGLRPLLALTCAAQLAPSRVAIADMFLRNAATNGEQAARSLDDLARNALFAPYLGGNTRVRTSLTGAGAQVAVDDGSLVHMVDGVAMVTREPIDRLRQIIAQSWYWIGAFCAPTDTTTNPTVIPTATNAAYKRAVVIEHLG